MKLLWNASSAMLANGAAAIALPLTNLCAFALAMAIGTSILNALPTNAFVADPPFGEVALAILNTLGSVNWWGTAAVTGLLLALCIGLMEWAKQSASAIEQVPDSSL